MRPFSPRAIMPHFNQFLLDAWSYAIDGAAMFVKSNWFEPALCALVFGCSMMFATDKAEAQATGRMELVCVGGGSAIKDASRSAYITDGWGNSASGTIYGTRRVGFDDEVSIWFEGDEGRIRMPSIMLPLFRGGEDGWFKLKSIKLTDREIIGSISVNPVNNPKLRIDRRTGAISIAGKAGNFTGRCEELTAVSRQSPAAAAQGPSGLYQTVDYLAKTVQLPFTVEAAAGTFTVTKVEAMDTQLSMKVLVSNPKLKIADVAAPVNLQVVCHDPALNEVLRLGGSIRLNFFYNNGSFLGAATQTSQSCRF